MIAVWYPEPVPISSTECSGPTSSSSVIRATMYGCEMVCAAPMGSAWSPYAWTRRWSLTNRCRGTWRRAARTRSSLIPRAAIRSRTIRSRWWAKSLMGSTRSWEAQGGQPVA